jgi:hypothetical protein
MIDLGSDVPLAINVADQTGAPTNASTITLTITLPDGTTASPAVANPPAVTGQYQCAYQTTQAGRHAVQWATTGPITAYTDVFDVAEASPPSIISLASIKRALGMAPDYTDDDDELREMMAGVTAMIGNYLHETIVPTTFTEEHVYGTGLWDRWPTFHHVRLWHVPVMRLISVRSVDGTIVWNTANLDLQNDTGLVRVSVGPPITGVTCWLYQAGYQVIPYHYVMGARALFQHVWEMRRGVGGVGGVIGPEELGDFKHYSSFPRKVTEILGPPRPVVA